MTANQLWLIGLAIITIASFSLAVLSLRLGLKWAKVAEISLWRAVGLFLVIWLTACLLTVCVALGCAIAHLAVSDLIEYAVGYAAHLFASCLVIAILYRVKM